MIVGLGNPGRDYAATRHNVGFMVVDELARRLSASDRRTRFRADVREAFDSGGKLVLLRPQTYMNLSGVAVREATRWYKTAADDILVVADDIDLPFGVLRLRAAGGSGGHNGLKSIFAELGTQDVPRLKIGVGRGSGHATRQVLTRFNAEEDRLLPEIIRAATDCALDWRSHGIIDAMNRCNRRLESVPGPDPLGNREDSNNTGSAAAMKGDTSSKPRGTGAYNRVRAWLTGHSSGTGGDPNDRTS